MVNSLLAAGEVPGLYTPEELNALLAPLQEECSVEGFYGGTYQFFVNRVQTKLHIALLFDPMGPGLGWVSVLWGCVLGVPLWPAYVSASTHAVMCHV